MPSEGFRNLVERAVTDAEFAARLQAEREAVLAEYDLSDDERQALLSRDGEKLTAVGLDERVSKIFNTTWW